MVVDTSALLAVILDEPEAGQFRDLIADASEPKVSAVSVLEASLVLEGRVGAEASRELDLLLRDTGFQVVAFDEQQLRLARRGWRRFGKGNHPAGLNLGDCASYALSKMTGEPLLFKGGDFAQTDVVSALVG
jgi:ribonuclease VapC